MTADGPGASSERVGTFGGWTDWQPTGIANVPSAVELSALKLLIWGSVNFPSINNLHSINVTTRAA